MPCLLCIGPLCELDDGAFCFRCSELKRNFKSLTESRPKIAYNWAIEQALNLAGDITGVEPGSAMLEIEDGELGLRTVKKVHTQVARSVPPELQDNDERKK